MLGTRSRLFARPVHLYVSKLSLSALRDGPCRSGPGARGLRRGAFRLSQSLESALQHAVRQEHLRRRRAVRTHDAPLWQADLRPRRNHGRRRRLSGPRGRRLDAAVLQSAPFRPARLPARARSAEAPDRRADVGPLCDAAPRHGRGVSAPFRRLHHRLGGCAHGAARGRPLRPRRLYRLPARDARSSRPGRRTRSGSASPRCRCSRRRR